MQDYKRPISTRIQHALTFHYDEKSKERYRSFVLNAEKFCSNQELPDNVSYKVQKIKLRALVKSYFLDVIKYKEYHFEPDLPNKTLALHGKDWMRAVHAEKEINHSKIFAFTVKWVMKHAPLSFWVDSDQLLSVEDEARINSANARFALHMAFLLIGKSMYSVDRGHISRLTYHLMYRTIDERSMFGWIENMLRPKTSDRSFNVFLASPQDVVELRDATEDVISQINEEYPGATVKLNCYRWENDKQAGASSKIQDDIFKEATNKWGGGECDILIVLAWHKFGEGTEKEFDHFFTKFVDNEDKKFIFCRYAKAIDPKDVDGPSLARLDNWVKKHQDKYSPLNATRGSIADAEHYKTALGRELRVFIRDK